jgi:hypothetical protein
VGDGELVGIKRTLLLDNPLIPAKAGTQAEHGVSHMAQMAKAAWVPAFAGMSGD